MIEEQQALLAQLERNPDIPLPQKRGMLHVLSQNLMYLSEEDQNRYKAIAAPLEKTRQQIVTNLVR